MRLLRSFYARLSLLFLLLVLLLGAVSLKIAFDASVHLFEEVEQKLNRDYAANIAVELEPFTGENFTESDIKSAIHYMMVLNPSVEIYLVDGSGEILCFFSESGGEIKSLSIDLEPVYEFMATDNPMRILGDDPLTGTVRKPFSAAPLNINGSDGWVYVILRSSGFDSSFAMLQSSYYIRTGVMTFLFAVIATSVAGMALFFILTRRLRRLSGGVSAFTVGEYGHRVEIGGDDELSMLGAAFNDMAGSIEEGVNRLQEAERLRRELIANISHDLRSPLTSIRGHLETLLLKEDGLSAEERREFIEISLRNVSGFQQLVEELFELAKLEARQVRPDKMQFAAAELIQDTVLKLRPAFERRKLEVSYNPAAGIPSLTADFGLVERMLTNIIENAVNHTPEGGRIDINLSRSGDGIIIAISDSGPGISSDDLPHIFERFYRADKSRSRDSAGTGLGLAIAREVAQLHGGRIEAESPPSGGAVFKIYLPFNL